MDSNNVQKASFEGRSKDVVVRLGFGDVRGGTTWISR